MFQQMKKRIKNEKGLTLIELLAVIVILAIIAAIAIPAIGNIIQNSRDKATLSEALNIISGAKIANMDGKCTENSCEGAVLVDYVDGVDATTLGGVTVALNTNNQWEITGFSKLLAIEGDYSVDETPSETEIKALLGNEVPTED